MSRAGCADLVANFHYVLTLLLTVLIGDLSVDIAFELFKKSTDQVSPISTQSKIASIPPATVTGDATTGKGWYERIFGGSSLSTGDQNSPVGIARQKVETLKEEDRAKLDGYYVRIRYNDKVMTIPGCKPTGKHLVGDESFCTLVSKVTSYSDLRLTAIQEAFKSIVDKYTPSHWKQACLSNMEVTAFPEKPEPAGY